MTIKQLLSLLTDLPVDTKVAIFASEADDELDIDLVEYYGPGKGNTVMLMDRRCEVMSNSQVLADYRDQEEG